MIGDNISAPPVLGAAAQQAMGPLPGVSATPASLIQKIDALAARLDAAAKAEEAKAALTLKNIAAKHWPWVVGVGVALTRFL